MLIRMMWLALAGGTVSRFAIYEMAARSKAVHLPLGAVAVNALGSFLFGFLYAAAESRLKRTAKRE